MSLEVPSLEHIQAVGRSQFRPVEPYNPSEDGWDEPLAEIAAAETAGQQRSAIRDLMVCLAVSSEYGIKNERPISPVFQLAFPDSVVARFTYRGTDIPPTLGRLSIVHSTGFNVIYNEDTVPAPGSAFALVHHRNTGRNEAVWGRDRFLGEGSGLKALGSMVVSSLGETIKSRKYGANLETTRRATRQKRAERV